MNILDLVFGAGLALSVGYLIRGAIKSFKEDEVLENTPIDVYRYYYRVCLSNGENYEKTANLYVNYSFEKFVKCDILYKDTLRISESKILNTQQIVKAELLSATCKKIKPIVTEYGIYSVYTDKEIEEREVK